jgi:hypothetical protein
MDQLKVLMSFSVDEIQKVLFLRKMPSYIRDIVNPRDFKDLSALTEQCIEIWENRCPDAGTAAAPAVPRSHYPSCSSHRISSPFRGKKSATAKAGNRRSPTPSPHRGNNTDSWCYFHTRFGSQAHKCKNGCTYQENK